MKRQKLSPSLKQLSDECLINIFSFFSSLPERATISKVNKHFYDLINQEWWWKAKVKEDFNEDLQEENGFFSLFPEQTKISKVNEQLSNHIKQEWCWKMALKEDFNEDIKEESGAKYIYSSWHANYKKAADQFFKLLLSIEKSFMQEESKNSWTIMYVYKMGGKPLRENMGLKKIYDEKLVKEIIKTDLHLPTFARYLWTLHSKDLIAYRTINDATILHVAAAFGLIDVVKKIVETNSIDIHAKTHDNKDVISYALEKGAYIASVFTTKNFDIDIKNPYVIEDINKVTEWLRQNTNINSTYSKLQK